MGFIENLRQELAAKEQAKQAQQIALSEEEALHRQRLDQAIAFQTESGIGDLVKTASDLLKRTGLLKRAPDPYLSGNFPDMRHVTSPLTERQKTSESDGVFNGAKWDWKHIPGEIEAGHSYMYVNVATRPSGIIVFYSRVTTVVELAEWRANQDVLENTLEKAFDNPGHEFRRGRDRSTREKEWWRSIPGSTYRAEF